MSKRHPLWDLLDQVQMDLRNAQGKLTAVRQQLAAMDLTDALTSECPVCKTTFGSRLVRDEHVWRNHDGALPQHIIAAERAAGFEPPELQVAADPA